MSVFLTLLPAWLNTIFYIYWVILVVLLIMGRPRAVGSRSPGCSSCCLCRLVGVFFYIFFGRDWKAVARRPRLGRAAARSNASRWRPSTTATREAVARFHQVWGGTIAEPHPRGRPRASRSPACCRRRRSSSSTTGPTSSPGSSRTSPRRKRVHPHAVLHLGAGPAHRGARCRSCSTGWRPVWRCASSYDWMGCIGFHRERAPAAQARGERPGGGRRHRPADASTTATTARSSSSTARSATPAG